MGTIEDFWGPSKKLLNDIKFLEGLQNYDKDNIPPAVMKKLMTTVMQDEGFVPEKIRAVSVAAEGTVDIKVCLRVKYVFNIGEHVCNTLAAARNSVSMDLR